jgi:hypothetical protein
VSEPLEHFLTCIVEPLTQQAGNVLQAERPGFEFLDQPDELQQQAIAGVSLFLPASDREALARRPTDDGVDLSVPRSAWTSLLERCLDRLAQVIGR